MKIVSKILLFAALLTTAWSCEKDENKIFFEGGTQPVLTSSSTAPALDFVNADKDAVRFNWTNPNFQFTTGISSQDVNYILEIDTVGANFTNPGKVSVAVSKELSKTFKVSELNDLLLNTLQLQPKMAHKIEARVKASIGSTTASNISNKVELTVTPYAIPPKVNPPASGKLFIVGNATPGGWTNPVPVPSQQFTQISETLYEITIDLVGGGAYLFIHTNGEWGKYNIPDDKVAGIENGGDFAREQAKDIPAPAAAGKYKIVVDFQRGKFTVTKQ